MARDPVTAQARFEEALTLAPTNQAAAALLGITRTFAVASAASTNTFLDGANVPAPGRDLYHWIALLPKDGAGNRVLPANYNLTTVAAYWQGTVIPTTTAARANLALVTDQNFLLTLLPAETMMPAAVNIDYGDVLMARAGLSALEFVFNFLSGQNLDANLAALNQLAQGDMLTLQRVLADNPNFAKLGDPAKRTAAQAALTQFIALYRQASVFIRARPPGLNRLFMLDPSDLMDEEEFRATLANAERSLTEPVAVGKPASAFFAGPLFGGSWVLRDQVPVFNATGGFDLESITDPSLGGVASGLTRERIAANFDHPELGWQLVHPNPPPYSLFRNIVLSNGKRIAAGNTSGGVQTSDDGSTWTFRPAVMARAGSISGMAEGSGLNAGKVVAAGNGGRIYVSSDSGVTWRQVLEGFENYRGVAYGNNRFVVVSLEGETAVSTDGETWSTYSQSNLQLRDVIYVASPGYFIAVGAGGVSSMPVIVTSADGTNWTNRFTAISAGTFSSVALGGTKLVVVGDSNHKAVSASTAENSAWTEGTVLATGTTIFSSVAYRGTDSLFFASGVGGAVAVSTDGGAGASWTSMASGETGNLASVAVAPEAVYFTGQNGVAVRSTDISATAATFARVISPISAVAVTTTFNNLRAIDGKLYAVGQSDAIMVSNDGQNFSAISTGTTTPATGVQLWSIMKQGSTYYAVGGNSTTPATGVILTSSDGGTTWSQIISGNAGTNSTSNLRFIDYIGGQFVASGVGTLLTSPTGATNTWTPRTLSAGGVILSVAYGVVNGVGTYVAAGGNNTNGGSGINFTYTSVDNGVTWVRRFPSTSSTFRGVVFNQGVFTAVGFDGAIFRSSDGVTWNFVSNPAQTHLVGLRVLDGRYYALQQTGGSFTSELQSAVLVSSDGLNWVRVPQNTAFQQFGIELFGGRLYSTGAAASVFRSELIPATVAPTVAALTPAGRVIKQGDPFALAVASNGDGGESYAWFKDGSGTPIIGADRPTLPLQNIQSGDAGSYVLKVTNAFGMTAAPAIAFTVNATPVAPTIVQQPESQTVTVGLTATFEVVAHGTAPFTYQWKKNGVNLANGGNVAGSGAATLTLTGVQAADAAAYSVEVSNGTAPVATSANALLAVDSNPAYNFSTLAGLAGSSATTNATGSAARFSGPFGVAADASGNLYVADNTGHTIRKIVISSGAVTTLAGTAGSAALLNATGTGAKFNSPKGLAFDPSSGVAGSLYVADYGNSAIRKIDLSTGAVTTFASGIGQPNFIVVSTTATHGVGVVFFTTADHTVRRISADGLTVTVFAGQAGISGWADLVGAAARFNSPQGIVLDGAGTLYVADMFNSRVRKIAPDGTVSTFTPYNLFPGVVDGPSGTVNAPFGLAIDGAGNVYVTESSGAQVVRKISPADTHFTIGGQLYFNGSSDGIGAAARFNNPIGLAVDSSGNLFVADNANNTVRKGVPSGSVLAPLIGVLPHDQKVAAGSNATFTVGVTGAGTLSYQWKKNGVVLVNGTNVAGVATATLQLTNLQAADAGSYTVVVTNAQGSAVSPVAMLTIPPAPEITIPPQNVSVVAGQSATFKVTASSLEPITYQWRRRGIPIPGATGTSFTIPNAHMSDADFYDVVAAVGTATMNADPVRLGVAPTQVPGIIAADPAFTPDPITISSRVYSAARLANTPATAGMFLVGGEFVRWDNVQRTGLARLNADLTLDQTYVPPLFNGVVHAIAEAPDGTVYVGGDFTAVDGHLRRGLARLTPTLQLDLAWQARDNAPASLVSALAVQSNGQVMVARNSGGGNGLIGGTNVIRRLNLDGTFDGSFTVDVTIGNGRIFDLIVEPSGSIAFGGNFSAVNSATRNGVARVSANGSTLDTAFGGSGTNANSGTVFSLKRLTDGRYLVAGGFTTIGGLTRNRLAILDNTTGAVDTNFAPTTTAGTDGPVYGATVLSDGKIFAGGNFTSYASTLTSGLVRLTTTGTIDQAYAVGSVGLGSAGAGRGLTVYTLPLDAVGLFGVFQSVLNARRVGVAVVNNDGTLAATPASLNYRAAYSGSAFVEADNHLTVFGSVDIAAGASGLKSAIRLNPDGTLDGAFPLGSGFDLNGLSTFGIFRAVRQGDGKTVVLGDFGSYNGTTANKLVRLNVDGTVDSSFNAATGPTFLVTTTIVPLMGGRTLLLNYGGTYNGTSFNKPLLRLSPTGAPETPYGSFGGGNPNMVVEYPDSDGTLIVAGSFTSYTNPPTTAVPSPSPVSVPGLVLLAPDGSRITDTNVGSGVNPAGSINGVAIAPKGNPIFFGNFTTFNGVAVNRIAIFDSEQPNLVDPSFHAAAAVDGPVGQVLPQEDGKFIVVGDFSGGPVIRLMPNGDLDNSFALRGITSTPAGNGAGLRVALDDAGSVYLYGGPVSIDYGPARSVVRFSTAPIAATVAVSPASGRVLTSGSTVLAVKASGTAPYTYQWKKGVSDILNANGSTLVLSNFQAGDVGDYSVVVSNGVGTPATSATAALTLGILPSIATQPVPAQIVTAGQPLTLTVVAQGAPTPTLQWRKNGVDISGATGTTYTIPSATAGDAGHYDVVVSNQYANVTSKRSIVTVAAAGGDGFPNFAWRNPLPNGGSLKSVTYGNSTFVAVGQAGKILTSSDGTNWTLAATVASGSLNAVTFSSALNLFIAVGNGGDIYTASNLATWTKQTSSTTDTLTAVAVGIAGSTPTVVAAGFNGRIAMSTTGTTWSSQVIAGNPSFNGAAAATDLFAVVGGNGAIYTSTNGSAWSVAAAPAGLPTANFTAVRFLNNQFVAVGGSGAVMTWTGTGNWTQVVTGVFQQLRDIALVGSTYVATTDNGGLLKAANLANWTTVDLPSFAAHYGVAASGTTFATAGSGGEIWTSMDATSWVSRGTTGGLWRFGAVKYLNGRFIAVGSAGAVYTSLDGDTWTRAETSTSSWLDSVAYGAGLYVAPSDFGDVLTSPDAVTWTTRTVGDNVNNNGVAFDGTRFVAVGDSGKIRTSTDGIGWTSVTGTGITEHLRSVAARSGVFVAVGDTGKIYTSGDGQTWTLRTSGTAQRLLQARLIEGTFFVTGEGRTLLASADGVTWLVLPISNSIGSNYRDIVRLPDGYYIVGDQGTLLKTADLLTATLVGTLGAGENLNGFAIGNGRIVIVGEGGALLKSSLPAAGATPVIAVHPAGITIDATKNVVLSVVASASGPLTYQWKKGTSDIIGATSSTLLIPNAATTATGSYTVVVANGANTATSNAAVVTVNALQTPAITTLPIMATATGGTVNMSVTATGSAPLTYQWYRGLSGNTANPLGTTANFTTSALTSSERYWVKVTNFAGQVLNGPTTTAVALTPRNPPTVPSGIVGLAYGNASATNYYVGVAGASIITSADNGVTWVRQTGLTGSTLRGVAYGNGTFVAVGDSGAIRTSSNGTTWASITSGSVNLNAVIYDGVQFVAVGVVGTVLTSDTGATWTTRTALAGAPVVRGLALVAGGYVAVGDNGALYTSDGKYNGGTAPTWTSRNSNTTASLLSVAPNTAVTPTIVVVGRGGVIRVGSAADLATWATTASPAANDLNGVTFGGGKFVVAANGPYYTSTDGIAWTGPLQPAPISYSGLTSALYANSQFMLGGYVGAIYTSGTADANTWTLRNAFGTTNTNDVFYGGGRYVVVGASGVIFTSTDGVGYTVKAPALPGLESTNLRRTAYGKGAYVVVGDGGTILTSLDAQNWFKLSRGTTNYNAAAFGAGKFVIAGVGGGFATSPDGLTWTTGVGTIGTSNVTALAFGGGLFVAVNNSGGIFTSPDGATWTSQTSGTISALNQVIFGGGKFVAIGGSSTVLTSPDGITWTPRTLGTNGLNLTGIAFGDGMYFAAHSNAGQGSTLFASFDAVTWNSTQAQGFLVNQSSTTGVAFGNGAFLFGGGGGVITQSLPATDVARIATPPPAVQTFANGLTVTLNVSAVGTSPTYQWYEGASGDISLPVVGATSASFTTPALIGSKRYWVRVNASGQPIDSAAAQLNGGPAVLAPPQPQTVVDGSPVTFNVVAIGAGNLSYQWRRGTSDIVGATGPSFSLPAATLSDGGNYSVYVSNAQGNVTSAGAALTVSPSAPVIGSIVATYGRNVPVGSNTELSIPVTAGTKPLIYQWKFNNGNIPNATNSTYFISNAQPGQSGTYSVSVGNLYGSTPSASFALTVSPELGWQWRNPLPTGNAPTSVKYLNGKFYLGGYRSTLLVSTDGAAWAPVAVPGAGAIIDLVAGNGRLVALGGLNALFTSDDGITWAARDSKIQDTNQLQSIAFGAGRFVAVGYQGHTTTSTDGVTWTPGSVPTSVAGDYLYYVRFVNGKFWVSSSDDNTVRTWTSADGLTWIQPALALPPGKFVGEVAFGNLVYAASGESDLLWSADGTTWNLASFALGGGSSFRAMRYVNDRFIAVGESGEIVTSTDAVNWAPQTSGVSASLTDVAFGNGLYVAVGEGNPGFVPNAILTSPNASTWTQTVAGPAQTTQLNGVASGNGKLVAVGLGGTIVTSLDGLAWASPSSGTTNNLLDVAYGNGVFVAVGGGAQVRTAADTDLTTWTPRTSNPTVSANLRSVKFGNGQFFAVGDLGSSIRSSDGTNWTRNTDIAGVPALFGTAFGAGVQVAVGNGGGIFSSADNGASWTVSSAGVATSGYSDVLFANNKFVAVGLGGLVVTSSNGLAWTPVTAFTTDNLMGLIYVGGSWIVTGDSSAYASPDGINWTPRYTGAVNRLRDLTTYGNQVIGVGANGTILAAGAPIIVAAPQNLAARAGASVKLVGVAANSPVPVTYQWLKDIDPTPIAGATSPILQLNSIAVSAAGSYRLVASNAFGSATSAAAQLTVSQAPTFTGQPVNVTAIAGQGVSFTATAVGTPTPTYQWQKDNVNLVNGPGIAGATTPTLTLTNVQPGAVGTYVAIATNTPAGEPNPISEPSQPATLTVNVPPAPSIASATPAIASGSVTVVAGGTATFNATATGTAPLSYRWRINGLNLSDGTNVSGAGTSTLTLTNIPLNPALPVTVAVTNIAGLVASSPVSLIVTPAAPVILSPLAVTAVLNAPFTYQTAINQTTATFSATNLPAGLSIDTVTGVISGRPTVLGVFNTITLTAHNNTADDTKTLAITVNPPPPVITSPVGVSGRVGQALSYTIVATNSPTSVGAAGLTPGMTRTGNVISGPPTQAGSFTTTVTAANATGSASQTVVFTIDPPLNAPVYGGSTQPSGTQGAVFSFTPVFTNPVNATNGYAITSGALPAGVNLNVDTGVISGTPTAVGSFAVTLTATGPGGATNVVLTIVINPAPSAPIINSATTASGTKGDLFSFTLTTDVPATSYNVTGLPGWLSLTGNALSGTPIAPGTLTLQISATNGTLTGPTSVLIISINPSPLAPVISSSPVVSTGRVGVATTLGTPLYQIAASNGLITLFEVTSGPALATFGLQLDAASGAVYGQPTVVGTYRVWFAASNLVGGRGPSLEVVFTIQPPLNVPIVSSSDNAAGQVGRLFSYPITGTNSPTSFNVDATSLPAWLIRSANFNTDGLLSGIPNVATVDPILITVTASNADGASAPKTVAISISPAPETPVISSPNQASGRVGTSLTYRMTASASPTSFSATGLPPGLSVDPATGVISGTPTQAGTIVATLSAGNGAGLGVTSPLTFAIASAPLAPVIISNPSATGKVGLAFSYSITATSQPITNPPTPVTINSYGLSGTLPVGLGFNTSTGVISGMPAESGYKTVSLTATSAAGTSLPQSLTIVVDPADNVPRITSQIYDIATVGVNYLFTILATNMPDSTPFPAGTTLEAVNLPPGLAVNPSTGVIQGQPSVAGTFVASLVGKNAAGTGLANPFTIYVLPSANAPVVTSVLTVPAQVGVGFSYAIKATNGPIAYRVLDAPAWMTVNSQSGVIGGSPARPGTFTVRLVASNSAGDSNPATLTLVIAAATGTPVVFSPNAWTGQLDVALTNYTILASNTPTSYMVTGLPEGLSFDSATGVISGTPKASGTINVTISANNGSGEGQPYNLALTISGNLRL